jgi:Xaa-Pro aminopeptidase
MGAGADAYGAIVGSGPNGCVLHYMANTRQARDGELVVMDYAPSVHGYCSDVTRTFPVNGKFTDEQRKLVQDVYDVQQALIAEVRPGTTLSHLSGLCSKLLRGKGYRVDHGPCHHVGLAVHDVGGDVLEPGMVFTVEPGAYLRDAGMGCRIEDVVLVTESGCVNLSAHVPATPDAIEKLMREPGVQQLRVGVGK